MQKLGGLSRYYADKGKEAAIAEHIDKETHVIADHDMANALGKVLESATQTGEASEKLLEGLDRLELAAKTFIHSQEENAQRFGALFFGSPTRPSAARATLTAAGYYVQRFKKALEALGARLSRDIKNPS